MADQSKWSLENAASLAGVVSSLGVATFLIVIIGRLWTTTYFEHFGLPSSSLEFNVYDYAFRSLEALISLVLGASAFSAAWLNRQWLRERGAAFALFEGLVIVFLVTWVFVLVELLPRGFYAPTGVLGLSSGLGLAAMIWFAVDVFEGPGDPCHWGAFTNKLLTWWPLSWLASMIGRQPAMQLAWRAVAFAFLLAVVFGYLPSISERLASVEARADLAAGRLPSAVLEADSALPGGIASDATDTKSHVVRVILSQPQNTYVLHSTQCTTIGQLRVPTRVERGDVYVPPEGPDVCKVFAIPTARLKSIEYVKVRGKAPANETRAHALEVGLDQEFKDSVNTQGATDEEDEDPDHRLCEGESARFYNSVWYAFEPSTDGAVFARAETPDLDSKPVIAIWEEAEPLGALKPVMGSDKRTGLACETHPHEVTHAPSDGQTESEAWAKIVGTIAHVRAGTRYVAAVADKEDKGGDVRVSFQFFPGAMFRCVAMTDAPVQCPAQLPSVLGAAVGNGPVLSQLTTATLELWEFDRQGYDLGPPSREMDRAVLVTTEGTPHWMTRAWQGEEEPPARFEAELCKEQEDRPCPGPSYVDPLPPFVGLARFRMSVEPPVVLSLEGTATEPVRHTEAQAALLLVLQEGAIRDSLGYEGGVIFDRQSCSPQALPLAVAALEELGDHKLAAESLLKEAGLEKGFTIQIQVEQEGQVLADAAKVLQERLLTIGLNGTIEPCTGACIRVYFGTPEEQ